MLTDAEILTILGNELSDTYDNTTEYETALDYYLGKPNGTEVEGRSQVVSTDVADAIEWIMPEIMKAFTQTSEIVVFDPVHQGDERQAELESQYVYEVLMKQNPGFILLHQFVKDALMQRNGILKVYYAKHDCVKTSRYTGITEEQLNVLLGSDGVEVLEMDKYVDQELTQQKQQMIQQQMQQMQQMQPQQIQMLVQEAQTPVFLYNVQVSVTQERGKVYIDPVPPEQFRVCQYQNSIDLTDARFTAHVTLKSVADIVKEYDMSFEEAKELPSGSYIDKGEFRYEDDTGGSDEIDNGDPSQRLIDVAECYIRIDVEENGIAKLMKITVAGCDNPSVILSMEEVDSLPWVATTTFLMSHKFEGVSITDRLRQIQDQKTAIWRNILDNMYLQNNQRIVVVENQVNLDDLLVSRPGGIIRTKRLDAISPFPTPQLSQDPYMMMEYLDKVRAGRTGVDADGTVGPTNIGDRVGSEGVDRLLTSKEELVGLIIRVIAETGIKPLCVRIRDLTMQHVDSVVDFRFRGVWQKVQPSEWPDRTLCTVRVGTGTGNRAAQLGAITQVITLQKEIMAMPGQTLLGEKEAYTAIDDFCKFSGLNGASRYFIDPESPEGQQKAQQASQASQEAKQKEEQVQMAMLKAQVDLANAEMQKANAQLASVQARAQTEQAKNQLTLMKQKYEAQLASLKQQLDEAKAITDNVSKDQELEFKYYAQDQKFATEMAKIEIMQEASEETSEESNDNES